MGLGSLLVTPLLQQGKSVLLPEARNVATVPDENGRVLTVAIRPDGTMYLGTDPVDMEGLERRLTRSFASNPALELRIKADRQAVDRFRQAAIGLEGRCQFRAEGQADRGSPIATVRLRAAQIEPAAESEE